VLGAAAGDHRLDAAFSEFAAVRVVVMAAIGEHDLGPLAPAADLAGDGGDTVDQGQLGDVVRLPPVRLIASGIPLESVSRWCLEPVRARSTGDGPVKAPLKSTKVAGVDNAGRPVDPGGRVEAAQQLAVQPLEYAGALPHEPPRRVCLPDQVRRGAIKRSPRGY
jgi:hypothetical protein